MSQKSIHKTTPGSENRARQSELIESRLLAESEEAFYMHRLRVKYSQIILLIAMIVPLVFVGILVHSISLGEFFLKGITMPKIVFMSSTILCFITIYLFLLSNMIKRPPTASNLRLGDSSAKSEYANENFDSKYDDYKDSQSKYRWRLIDGNNEIIARSEEGFSSKQSLIESVDKIRQHASNAPIYIIDEDGNGDGGYRFQCFDGGDGDGYWRLVAGNGEMMAIGGEGYSGGANAAKRALKDNIRAELGRANVPW